VGVTPTGPFHPFVPRVIRAFREAFPLVSLTLEECLSPELLKRLRNEQMDAAFLRTPMAEPEDLVIDSLLEEPMVVALPCAHALAQNDSDEAVLSLKDLAGETFIVYARQHGPGLYDATTAACLKAGFNDHGRCCVSAPQGTQPTESRSEPRIAPRRSFNRGSTLPELG
jgi:DNA-binding transcriptional LysR family regulator